MRQTSLKVMISYNHQRSSAAGNKAESIPDPISVSISVCWSSDEPFCVEASPCDDGEPESLCM